MTADGSPASIVPVPFAIYWLDSTDGLKPLVGQIVDVTGRVAKRESKLGTITLDIQPADALPNTVSVESGSKDVATEKFRGAPGPAGASRPGSITIVTRPVYKLDVKDVRPVPLGGATGPPCR